MASKAASLIQVGKHLLKINQLNTVSLARNFQVNSNYSSLFTNLK